MSGNRVVIVGVASHWGAELARRLERDRSIEYLAGIDSTPPPIELERTDFIEADIRSPLLSRLLPGTEADTVVHCGILWYPEPGKPSRVLHRGDGAQAAAPDPLSARRVRAGGLLRQLRPAPLPPGLLHASVPARDRPGPRDAAGPLPQPPRRPHPARVRPAPATAPRR